VPWLSVLPIWSATCSSVASFLLPRTWQHSPPYSTIQSPHNTKRLRC
jgi:hypothetical protein